MNRTAPLIIGSVDLAAVLFAIGGVASFVMGLLSIPLATIMLPGTFSTVFFIVLAISLICSLGAIHCYSLATKRLLSEAGMRGMIFGTLLLIFSLGFAGNFGPTTTNSLLTEASAVLIIIGGITCFVLRHVSLFSAPLRQQQPIHQSA